MTSLAKTWEKLDNAAKIFPANSTPRDTKVFRFACELTEAVDPATLGQALDDTLAEFPLYRSVLKRGMFWYYFEASRLPVQVREDDLPPCAPLYDRVRRQLLFRVSHFGERINLEVHHSLADGTGAMHFLCSLVYHYLVRRHPDALGGVRQPEYDASPIQKREDSFMKYYDPAKAEGRKAEKAYQIKGATLPDWRMRIFEGVVGAQQTLGRARARGATLTAYLTAQLMVAISGEIPLRHRDRPVVITVPVNLRPYYHSQTARNFFATMDIGYDFRLGDAFEDVLAGVVADFKKELTPAKMAERMNKMISLETNVISRAAPLLLKDVVLRAAGDNDSKRHTASVSNLGIVKMPDAMRPYIRRFSIVVATPSMQMGLITFGDTMTIGLTSAFTSAEVPRRFFRQLAADGIDVGVTSNLPGEDDKP